MTTTRNRFPYRGSFRLGLLLGDERGDVAVEYIALIGTIALPAIAAFMAAGRTIVQNYGVLQNVLSMPLP